MLFLKYRQKIEFGCCVHEKSCKGKIKNNSYLHLRIFKTLIFTIYQVLKVFHPVRL